LSSSSVQENRIKEGRFAKNVYLLEYRYSGYPKSYILDIYSELQRAYRIHHPNYHYVPHLSVAGPIETNNEKDLVDEIRRIIHGDTHHFNVPGNLIQTGKLIKFETEDGGQVLGIEVKPPRPLIELKKKIELDLGKKFSLKIYKKEIWHTTIWNMKSNYFSNKEKFLSVWHSLENNPQEMKFILDRITLIKNGKILEEYDLFHKEVLTRIESLNNSRRYDTYLKMKAHLQSQGESFKF